MEPFQPPNDDGKSYDIFFMEKMSTKNIKLTLSLLDYFNLFYIEVKIKKNQLSISPCLPEFLNQLTLYKVLFSYIDEGNS